MNDYILTQIENYLRNELVEPCNFLFLPDSVFKKMSYARETVTIIIERIIDHPFEDARDILWLFQMEIEHYCRVSKNSDVLSVFHTMRDTAEEISQLIA